MVAVGLWAGLVGGKARLAYPLAFVAMMVVAGLWGMSGAALPGVEIGIAVSVIVLGLAIALKATPPLAAGIAACAIFAIFHGHAHGAELPEGAGAFGYAAGFVLATAALHGVGLALAEMLAQRAPLLARVAGGGLVLAGVAILAS
jgi:urease accessory protein